MTHFEFSQNHSGWVDNISYARNPEAHFFKDNFFSIIYIYLTASVLTEFAYHIASRQLTKAENLNPLKIFSNAWSIGWLQTMNSYTYRQSKQIEWLIEFMCHNFSTPSKRQ